MDFPTKLLSELRSASRVAVLTGAGVSAESGVPTFRDAQTGLWAQYRPEDLATPEAFRRDPELVWKWYAWRRDLVQAVQPNPGHYALVEIEQHIPEFTLITQNVDGLHHQAGSRKIIELHGNIQRTKCFSEGTLVTEWRDQDSVPPHCPHCGDFLRPDVVWFGENLPAQALDAAYQAAERCQIFISVGTSGVVQPAASLPYIALRSGATLVEINPTETPLTPSAHFVLPGPSGSVLPALKQAAWAE